MYLVSKNKIFKHKHDTLYLMIYSNILILTIPSSPSGFPGCSQNL